MSLACAWHTRAGCAWGCMACAWRVLNVCLACSACSRAGPAPAAILAPPPRLLQSKVGGVGGVPRRPWGERQRPTMPRGGVMAAGAPRGAGLPVLPCLEGRDFLFRGSYWRRDFLLCSDRRGGTSCPTLTVEAGLPVLLCPWGGGTSCFVPGDWGGGKSEAKRS